MKWFTLEETNAPEQAARSLLRALMEGSVARAVLTPVRTGSGAVPRPALIADPGGTDAASVFSPHQLVSVAKLLADFTVQNPGGRIAAVLKPCEQRAFVELVKFRQADRDPVLTITTDCAGTVDTTRGDLLQDRALDGAAVSPGDDDLRPACAICGEPALSGDLHLGALGTEGRLLVGIGERAEAIEGMDAVMERMGAQPAGPGVVAGHESAVAELKDSRLERREIRFGELYGEFADLLEFAKRFETCRLCFNCRRACPICYCRECLFEGPTFEPEGAKFIRWAEKKGLLPLPADVVLFHLTRMNHMVLSCVGCGQCTSACPNDLPVAELFSAFGERARKLFDYQPGTSYDVAPPLTVFREQELAHVTEPTGKVMSE